MNHAIRLAAASDYPALVSFIDQHWQCGHVFTRSKKLLDWQHWNGIAYNFVLGVNSRREIDGVFGFIPDSQYDPGAPAKRIFLAIWKVRDEARGTGLGRRLLDFIEQTYQPTTIATIGATEMTLPMYKARGYKTGRMSHYYIKRNHFSDHDESIVKCESPTSGYMASRYTNHPWYTYNFHDIAGTTDCLITRVCASDNVRGLRVVDFTGPSSSLRGLLESWQRLLSWYSCDWVDFYCAGINHDDMVASGFTLRTDDSNVIIPNHFEPFERNNIEIDYAIKTTGEYRLTKGMGDQDRPNQLPVES